MNRINGRRTARMRRTGAGFTLVELLVVIAVIAILLAIGAGIGSVVRDYSSRALTEVTLQNLAGTLKEYEAIKGKAVSLSDDSLWTSRRPNSLGSSDNVARRDLSFTSRLAATRAANPNTSAMDQFWSTYVSISIEQFVAETYDIGLIKKFYDGMPEQVLTDKEDIVALPSSANQAGYFRYNGGENNGGNGFLEVLDGWGNKIVYVNDARSAQVGGRYLSPDGFADRRSGAYFVSGGSDKRFGSALPLRDGQTLEAHRKTGAYQRTVDNLFSTDL